MMQNVNYGDNFYTLMNPIAAKIVTPTQATLLAPGSAQVDVKKPMVVITGRGKTAGRIPNLVRLRPAVVEEIKSLVDGPLYLTIELALGHYAKEIRSRTKGTVEMIKASDLG